MSVLGFVSPSNSHPCGHCGARSGGNVLHLSATSFTSTPYGTLADGSMWNGNENEDVYVCDVCLWSVLRGAFGYLLKAELDATP